MKPKAKLNETKYENTLNSLEFDLIKARRDNELYQT